MKAEELRELDADELGNRLRQSRRELYELRFKLAVGQLENNREIHRVRRDIARILTVIHQQRFAGTPGSVEASAPEPVAAGVAAGPDATESETTE